jgi:flagellar basal-body rod modification protein FlgD
MQAAGMLGRAVLVPTSQGVLASGGTVDGAVELSNSVSSMNIGIYDQSGQLVKNIGLGSQSPGMVTFSWDGLATDGSAVPPGRYEVRAEAISGGINEAYEVLIADTVQSVSLPSGGSALTLELAGIGTVDFSQVRQIS